MERSIKNENPGELIFKEERYEVSVIEPFLAKHIKA
jgi:hypothetical protein